MPMGIMMEAAGDGAGIPTNRTTAAHVANDGGDDDGRHHV